MIEIPTLFDEKALVLRGERAARLWPSGDFLHRRVAEGLAERLGDVPRRFETAAVIGSGGGTHAAAMRATGQVDRLVQIEASPAMAARAATVAPVAGDAIDAVEPASLDLAIGGLALHRENDPVGALVQTRLALRPDGLFLGALFGGQTLHELRASLAEAEAAVEGGLSPRVAPMADLRDLGALLQRAGFAMPVADVERVTVDYADPFALMRDLRAMGEANALAGRRRGFTRRETLMRAAAIYAEHFSGPDGRVRATFDIVFLSGWAPGPGQPVAKRPGSATARLADALSTEERPAGEKAGR